MNPSPTARLRLVDRLSREWYVFKVELLAQDVPSGYRKERRRLPHVWTGVITFTIIFYAWAGIIMATSYTLFEAARQLAGDRVVTVHASWPGTNVVVNNGPHLLSGQLEPSGLTLAVLIVVPLLAARTGLYRPAWLQRRLASRAVTAPDARRVS